MDGKRNREPFRLSLGLIVLTIAAYWGVWANGFVNWDDQQYVYENPHVISGLSWTNFVWAWTTGACSNWHPLTWLSLMLDASLFGRGPAGFHVTNLALHVANVVLLFSVLSQFTEEVRISACAAAMFAVHPGHVESVAWISERKDVLCFFFGLLALRAYGQFAEKLKLRFYFGSLTAFAASLLAKPMLVTFPFLLILLDHWPLKRLLCVGESDSTILPPNGSTTAASTIESLNNRRLPRLLAEKFPFFLLSALSCLITYQVQQAGGAVESHLASQFRLANAVIAYGNYVSCVLIPADFSVFYPHARTSISWLLLVGSLSGLALITFAAIALRRRAPYVITGWLWFLGMLVPVIGIIQVGTQGRADRYLYIPAIGIYLVVSWSASAIFRRSRYARFAPFCLMISVLTFLAIKTNTQTRVWQNSVTLWSHSLQVVGNSFRIQTQLAQSLQAVGDRDGAQRHYEEAFKLQPKDPHLNVNYGLFLAQKERYAESIPYFQTALETAPRDSRTLGLLGYSLWQNHEHAQSEAILKQAIEADPQWSRPYYWLGQLYAEKNQRDLAIENLRHAVQLEPTWKLAAKELARIESEK